MSTTSPSDTLIFFKTNPVVAGIVILFIIFCFYAKPKESLKFVAFIVFLAVAFYIITMIAGVVGSGTTQKGQMIYKTEEAARD